MRKIIHIDMDCFYAAVEVRDNPALRGQAVAVGGLANQRGVLCACNYEARKFGLHAAMPTARAIVLCPSLILLPVNMEKYRQVSQALHKIFRQYTDIIEPLSLDEAYLDVTHSLGRHESAAAGCHESAAAGCHESATGLAQVIRHAIQQQQGLTASAGVAPNKFLAKVASDWNKPDGQFVIPPQKIAVFVQSLAVEKLPGVGKVTASKLHAKGIRYCQQLQPYTQQQLADEFGKFGVRLYDYCRGIDHRDVQLSRIRKSLSVETTFLQDLTQLAECEQQLEQLYDSLVHRLEKHTNKPIHKQFIKLKFSDFSQITRECVVQNLSLETFVILLRRYLVGEHKAIRLLGIGVRFCEEDASFVQQTLW